MANTSATGGFLSATPSPAPLEGSALDDFFQAWIVGITGVVGALVRPRWQPEPPNIPKEDQTWVAFGITKREADSFAAELHYPDGQGYNEIRRHEIVHLLLSFYGPAATSIMETFREGIQVSQNHEYLATNNMGLVASGDAITVPELVKEKWLYRVDLSVAIRRQIVRDYAILNIATANGTLDNEHYVTPLVN